MKPLVNHPWFGFTRFYCTVCHNSDHIKRNWNSGQCGRAVKVQGWDAEGPGFETRSTELLSNVATSNSAVHPLGVGKCVPGAFVLEYQSGAPKPHFHIASHAACLLEKPDLTKKINKKRCLLAYSLKTLSTLPRPVRPIFSKISDKLIFISSCVICQLFQDQEAMVSLKKQSFLDPTAKKRYMMPGAMKFSFNQTRRFKMDFGRNLGLVTNVHRSEILGYRVLKISLFLVRDVQGSASFASHGALRYLRTDVHTYNPAGFLRNLHCCN